QIGAASQAQEYVPCEDTLAPSGVHEDLSAAGDAQHLDAGVPQAALAQGDLGQSATAPHSNFSDFMAAAQFQALAQVDLRETHVRFGVFDDGSRDVDARSKLDALQTRGRVHL